MHPVAALFLPQVPFARVVGRCLCGCRNIQLRVDPASGLRVDDVPGWGRVAEGMVEGPVDVFEIEGMVCTADGWLAEFQVWRSGGLPLREVPPLASWRSWDGTVLRRGDAANDG